MLSGRRLVLNWLGRRVAVTGSAGVIGRRLLNLLSSQGAVIGSLDSESIAGRSECERYQALRMALDLCLPRSLLIFDPEVIFHLAASFERSDETG